MSFELLDELLNESGYEGSNNEGAYNDREYAYSEDLEEGYDEDSSFYADLDTLTEAAMKESLRSLIFEMDLGDDARVDQLMIVENAEFTEDQYLQFMHENITPVVELAGLNEAVDADAISVPLPVYEAALALWWHEMGGRELAGKAGLEEYSGLHEAVFGTKSGDSLTDDMRSIFESYGYDYLNEREALVSEAISLLDEFGIDGLSPDVNDVAEFVRIYNVVSEGDEYMPSLSTLLEQKVEDIDRAEKMAQRKEAKLEKKAGRQAKKYAKQTAADEAKARRMEDRRTKRADSQLKKYAKQTAADEAKARRMEAQRQGLRKQRLDRAKGYVSKNATGAWSSMKKAPGAGRDRVKSTWQSGRKGKAKVGGAALAAAGIAAGAMMAYKKMKNRQCAGLSGDQKRACMRAAAMKGLQIAQAAARKNPESKGAQREVEKWKTKVSKYS